MKFALATPAIQNYPAGMAPWEPMAGGQEVLRFAKFADSLSWDWLTVPEHVLMPSAMVEMMGSRFVEGISASSVLLGATERIRLLTYVLVLPYRNPVMLAKQIATMDFLTGGRFTLGTAVGHLEQEFEVLNVPFAERGRITDEYLQALKECWVAKNPHFEGEYIQFKEIAVEPKPLQQPHPPIFIGGNSKAAMRRAAKFGDGWIPWLVTREELPECIEYMRQQEGFEEKGNRFEVVMPTTAYNVEDYSHQEMGQTKIASERDEILRDIELLKNAGATVAQVMPPRVDSFEQCLEWVEWFDTEIIPHFR